MWRVMTARHNSAQLSFMLVGHTKFAPEIAFLAFSSDASFVTIAQLLLILNVHSENVLLLGHN